MPSHMIGRTGYNNPLPIKLENAMNLYRLTFLTNEFQSLANRAIVMASTPEEAEALLLADMDEGQYIKMIENKQMRGVVYAYQ